MKDTWKALATGAICFLLMGAVSVLGFVLVKGVPWLSTATVVADLGIIFGGYKIILETIESANELKKVSLENEKLKLEIEEKKSAVEKANAYVVVATLDEIEKYGIHSVRSSKSGIKWARTGIGIISTSVVVVMAGAVVFLKKTPQAAPPVNVGAKIVVAKAPPGAQVSIDGKPQVATDAQGNISIAVDPGPHKLMVAQAGFEPFSEDITVDVGETYREPIPALTALSRSGRLALADIPKGVKVKVFVDGAFKGTVSEDTPISLEAGTHHVRYSAPGYVDSSNKPITIALNGEASDAFSLVVLPPPPPNQGNLEVDATPGARLSVDSGKQTGVADASGKYSFKGLTPGIHSIDAQLDGYTPVQGKQIEIKAGQNSNSTVQLSPIAPTLVYFKADQTTIEAGQSVTLSWQVSNASSVSIEGMGTFNPKDARTVSPEQTTTYKLSANNGSVAFPSVTVTVRPKTQATATTATVPAGDDGLGLAINTYKSIFIRASGKSTKECQAVFNGSYQALKPLAGRCDNAKQFVVTEKCTEPPVGTDDAPSLICNEKLKIISKDGHVIPPVLSRKTFHFSKNIDGSWRVATVD